MKVDRAELLDALRRKAQHGMQVIGKSVFVWAKALIERAMKIAR